MDKEDTRWRVQRNGKVNSLFVMKDDSGNKLLRDLVDSLELNNILVKSLELHVKSLQRIKSARAPTTTTTTKTTTTAINE
jgi:hypothetical protein